MDGHNEGSLNGKDGKGLMFDEATMQQEAESAIAMMKETTPVLDNNLMEKKRKRK